MEGWQSLVEVSRAHLEALDAWPGSWLTSGLYHGQDAFLHRVRKSAPGVHYHGQVGGQTISCSVHIRFLFCSRSTIRHLGVRFSHLRAMRSGRRGRLLNSLL